MILALTLGVFLIQILFLSLALMFTIQCTRLKDMQKTRSMSITWSSSASLYTVKYEQVSGHFRPHMAQIILSVSSFQTTDLPLKEPYSQYLG